MTQNKSMLRQEWGDKPYFGLSTYLKETFNEKIYKLSLDGGFTCPNRDGTLDYRGCIFCSSGGSGEFAAKGQLSNEVTDPALLCREIQYQIETALEKFGDKKIGKKYIAYFQAYTNTYASKERLIALYEAALLRDDIIGISIATRPDCLGYDVQEALSTIKKRYPSKFIWVELGLQSIHEKTATYIRRGYSLSCFENALTVLNVLEIPVIVHVILGLPFETKEDVFQTISYLNQTEIFGIKLQLLHVLKNTDLEKEYQRHVFDVLTFEEYLSLLTDCIDGLRPDIVIHRVTGDGPKDLLLAPTWSLNKRNVLNSLHRKMRLENHYQGRNPL